jgi:hypothetical protein
MTAAQRKYWDFVGSLPCQLCGCHGVQISHSNQERGLSQKSAWWRVAAICPTEHYEIDNGKEMTQMERRYWHLLAEMRTIDAAIQAGRLVLK